MEGDGKIKQFQMRLRRFFLKRRKIQFEKVKEILTKLKQFRRSFTFLLVLSSIMDERERYSRGFLIGIKAGGVYVWAIRNRNWTNEELS